MKWVTVPYEKIINMMFTLSGYFRPVEGMQGLRVLMYTLLQMTQCCKNKIGICSAFSTCLLKFILDIIANLSYISPAADVVHSAVSLL